MHQGCTKEFIDNLPINKKSGECYICLNGLEEAKGIELCCGHGFCRACIEKWLVDHDTCPVCRKKVNEPRTSINELD